MRALLVRAGGDEHRVVAAAAGAAARALLAAGYQVDVVDLHAEAFRAAMTAEERAAYHGEQPILSETVRRHAELVRHAELLVFAFRSRELGLPAALKGWLERVLVPGVAFHLDERTNRVVADLRHVRRVVGIAAYDEPRWQAWLLSDGGRRTLQRALVMLCHRPCRRTWLGLYRASDASADAETAFLSRVERRLRAA
jgi:putative NADPH-quinone reductase